MHKHCGTSARALKCPPTFVYRAATGQRGRVRDLEPASAKRFTLYRETSDLARAEPEPERGRRDRLLALVGGWVGALKKEELELGRHPLSALKKTELRSLLDLQNFGDNTIE